MGPPEVAPFAVPAGTRPGRFLLRVLFSAKRLTFPAALLAILWQVGEAFVPVAAGAAIDQGLAAGDGVRLLFWLVVLGVVFVVLSLSYRFTAQLVALAAEGAQHRLRVTLSRRVLHPEVGATRPPDGSLVSTMTNDIARTAAMALVVFPVGELAAVVFIAVSLLVIHWPLGVAVLIGGPLVVWLTGVLSGRLARDTRAYQTLLAQTVGQTTDLVAGYRVIKGIRAEEEATRRYRTASRATLHGAYRNLRLLGRFIAGSIILSGAFVAGVAVFAGWFAASGQLSIGELIASVGLAQALLAPLQMLAGNAVPGWAMAVASSGRVLEQVAIVADEAGAEAETGAVPCVGRDAATVPVVELSLPGGLAVRVEPGELLGIRADDHLATALSAALLHPQHGDVRVVVDGEPATGLTPATYRGRVAVAPHHSTLFTGTVADNLHLPGEPGGVAEGALHAAGCDDFLPQLGGIDGHIGEMGGRLSGGQRQRLTLARALATDAPVLVLHDPTTAVDTVTEATIASRLRETRSARSTILIASSPALLAACDRVIDLRGIQKQAA